ncbi:MAG: ABC transporter substrate-binding protein, partial [Rhodobacteraceae bacterium]|nr:ABC transporter substrate-binding protein [Paracoccaceae bacterium]
MTQRAKAISVPAASWHMRLAGGLLALTAAAFAHAARADEGKVIVSHGISTFGELKYPAGFTHLDYVNPDAPKGGEISQWAPGGFDSLNPYSVKGMA